MYKYNVFAFMKIHRVCETSVPDDLLKTHRHTECAQSSIIEKVLHLDGLAGMSSYV